MMKAWASMTATTYLQWICEQFAWCGPCQIMRVTGFLEVVGDGGLTRNWNCISTNFRFYGYASSNQRVFLARDGARFGHASCRVVQTSYNGTPRLSPRISGRLNYNPCSRVVSYILTPDIWTRQKPSTRGQVPVTLTVAYVHEISSRLALESQLAAIADSRLTPLNLLSPKSSRKLGRSLCFHLAFVVLYRGTAAAPALRLSMLSRYFERS